MQHNASFEELNLDGSCLSIGTFDGVHLGHQAIVRQLVESARKQGLPAIVLTFFPHPAIVLKKRQQTNFITSPQEQADLLGKMGVDIVITYPFTVKVAQLSAQAFITQLYEKLHFRELVVGYDFAMGKGREGNVNRLREIGEQYHFSVQDIKAVKIEGQVVSSSQIRNYILEGKVREARRLLGHHYSLNGKVVPGDGRGKLLNIPTANLEIWAEKAIPRVGVYVCIAHQGKVTRGAVTNIGVRPTFEKSPVAVRVEAHLLDYEDDLYGKMLELEFIDRIRDEMRFNNVDNLVNQIQMDIGKAKVILSKS
jgi:riboflavin kinase/FMN adenylyltransferase